MNVAFSGTTVVDVAPRIRRVLWHLVAVLLSLCAVSVATASSYYFSNAGSDLTGNGSIASPWQSIGKFDQLTLRPGDNAYFRAGDVFSGKMYLDSSDGGTNASGQFIAPVKIGSYGASGSVTRAKIISPVNSEGFVAYNTGGVELSDLEFVSGGMTGGVRTNGVQFMSDLTGTASLSAFQHVRVNDVVSHGFGLNGLQVWSHVSVGFSDVKVTNSEFYNNGYSGVYVGGTRWHETHNSNVTIDHVVSHDNPGFVSTDMPYTGHGIVMAQVNGGTVQNSTSYDNGLQHGNANYAFFTWGSNGIVVQNNLAYGNRSPGGFDGGAYDIDGGTTNSVVQYNRSYDNDGPGMLLAEFAGADPMYNNLFRYNLSVNDGRNSFGGITVWGTDDAQQAAKYAVFNNNTVVVDHNVVPNSKGAVWFDGAHHNNITLANNALVALNGASLIAGDTSTAQSSIVGNSYWTAGGKIVLEDATYANVQAWAAASQFERLGGQFTGITADPKFYDATLYRPEGISPLVDKGRLPGSAPWPSWVTSLGGRDLGGTPVYLGAGPDIGAWESVPGDFNGDGVVDAADYSVWRNTYGSTTDRRADANLNGIVDQADYQIWISHYGANSATNTGFGADSPVPEPATIILLAGMSLPTWLMMRHSRKPRP